MATEEEMQERLTRVYRMAVWFAVAIGAYMIGSGYCDNQARNRERKQQMQHIDAERRELSETLEKDFYRKVYGTNRIPEKKLDAILRALRDSTCIKGEIR